MSARFWFAPFVFSAGVAGIADGRRRRPPGRAVRPLRIQRPAPDQDQTTLDDQVDLAVTVYNSDLALVRDVRELRLARGVARAPVHGHRGDRQPRDRPLPLDHAAVPARRPRAELRVRPARAREAAAQVRRPRRHARAHAAARGDDDAGGSDGAAPELQQRARLADRRRDHHRPARRSHPVSRAAGESVRAADADLDAAERRRRAAPRRGRVSRRQAVVGRGLRAECRARRQGGRSRRLGHADQRQRDRVPQRAATARGRRSQSRPPGDRAT